MFEPQETTERFDRNIFNPNNTNETTKLKFKSKTELLYYYKTNVIVGYLSGDITVKVFPKFSRNGFIPLSVIHKDKIYCGWVNENDLIA